MAEDADLGYATEARVAAAREILRSWDDETPMTLGELLAELGDRFPTTPAMWRLLNLIYRLWDGGNIKLGTAFGGVHFWWSDEAAETPHPPTRDRT